MIDWQMHKYSAMTPFLNQFPPGLAPPCPAITPIRPRLAWIEGIRIFAAVLILVYHYQLLFTDYAFAPQPTGLADNLQRLGAASVKLGGGGWASLPGWFGYQFVDVFILMSGFSLVLSLKGQPLHPWPFLQQRLLRILLPLWTVTWLAFPILWTIGKTTQTYIPSNWSIFAGMTFPLLFEYGGNQLLPTSGPWWFIPLILSFTAVFPLLWQLQQRWGIRNLLGVAAMLTIVYRAIAVYALGGHPTYVMFASSTGAQPFVPFLAKFVTFVIGMAVALRYQQWRGPLFWSNGWALGIGLPIYALGFVLQFYQVGWLVADSLIAIGLSLGCMVLFRFFDDRLGMGRILRWLGKHSYSFFLIHNFVIDRLIRLVIHQDLTAYYIYLPIAIGGTLALAVGVDHLIPKVEKTGARLWQWLDRSLTPTTAAQASRAELSHLDRPIPLASPRNPPPSSVR
jgi:peptidoglycan/LPS O-acetylase OafA/YrhL